MEDNYLKERETYDKVREKLDHTLGISFCKLMELYPLYDHRVEQLTGGDAVLSIILVGRGQPLELLLDKVLSNGQLLATDLQVTVVTPDAEADMCSTIERAPDLHRFIRIQCRKDGQVIKSTAHPEWQLGLLTFEQSVLTWDSFQTVLEAHPNCTFFLFDEICSELAKACSENPKNVVACITKEENSRYSLFLFGSKNLILSCEPGDEYLDSIESVAYNLHYAYMKANDPHTSNDLILSTFYTPYNYQSNIECAVHIRSKLRCCGISTKFDRAAAMRFSKELEYDRSGVLVETLACLEHRRWCISKMTQGYRLPYDLSLIFSDVAAGTHDARKKWHSCLVPFRDSRPLTEADWIAPDPLKLDGLDELDRQTLLIHRLCGDLLDYSGPKIKVFTAQLLQYCESPIFADDKEITIYAQKLSLAISQLADGHAEAKALYDQSLNDLKKRIRKYSEWDTRSIMLLLEKLEPTTRGWIEYLLRKDYKEQNRVLIRQIPFALSKWQNLTLVNLLSDRIPDCVYSAWQIEPSRIIFVDLVDSFSDILHIDLIAEKIDYFLKNSCNNISADYHFFIYGELLKYKDADFLTKRGYFIHPVASADPDQIRPEFVALMNECGADYIDLTGGKPELVGVAAGYAQNSPVGAFVVRNEQLCNFYGANGVRGMVINRGMSIQDVFNQSGAVKVKRGDEKLTGRIAKDYQIFWEIAHRHSEHWHGFCMSFVSKVRERARRKPVSDRLLLPQEIIDEQLMELDVDLRTHCSQILKEMVAKKLIEYTTGGLHVTSNELMAALVNSGKVLEYFLYFSALKCSFKDVAMSYQYKHSSEKHAVENELDVICTKDIRTLFISAKNVSAEKSRSADFLKNVCYELDALARRIDIKSKRVLAVPNAKQFENGELSKSVIYCMQRGVYLLGEECCQPESIITVLKNIMDGKRDWCGFLNPQPAGVK